METFKDFNLFAESHVAEIANAVPVGVAITNSQGAFYFVNAELVRMTGYQEEDLLGKPVDLLLAERFRSGLEAQREGYNADVIQRYMGIGRELFARRRDGSEFPVEMGLRPMETTAGLMTVVSMIDVSDRRRLETSFRAMMDVAPYGMLMIDEAGSIAMVNEHLCAMFGYAGTDLLGQPSEMLQPVRHRSGHGSGWTIEGAQRMETGLRKDGREMPLEIGLTSVVTEAGAMVLIVVVDLTQRKRAELLLREANAQLEEFTNVSSHDLRGPIRGISSLIDFVKEDLGDSAPESVIHNLDRMAMRLERMERMIVDLLDYARSNRRGIHMEHIDLPQLLHEIVEMEPLPAGMKLELDIRAQEIDGARTPLTTVLRNIYSNAIKHHDKPNGQIAILAREEGGFCVISVIDDGPGIPKVAQARVFRLFQTLSATERAGGGLGLAVAKRLTESHAGRIELISIDDRPGCNFEVWWPRFMRSELND